MNPNFHRHSLKLMFALLLTLLNSSHAAPGLDVEFNDTGLAKLHYGGQDFLLDGRFAVVSTTQPGVDGKPEGAYWADARQTTVSFEEATKTLTWKLPWGSVATRYTVDKDRLDLDMTVTNSSDKPLDGVNLQPFALKFPQAPKGWIPGYPYMGANLSTPTALLAQFDTATLILVNKDTVKPLLIGFPGRASLTERPLMVATENAAQWLQPLLDPYLPRPIAPGQSDTFGISLRFGAPDVKPLDLFPDVAQTFLKAHPFTLKWDDRRPLAALFLSTSEPEYHSPTNPRGWFLDPKMDYVSEAGRAKLRERVMAYADNSIGILKAANAQGAIVWDVEGQEYPHATSYIGDPRLLPTLAPEMDSIADEFFKKFTDAGLKMGVTIRPQILKKSDSGVWYQTESPDPLSTLREKIVYARKRWGVRLFYVDSNGDPNVPMPASIFTTLAREFPDTLLMPEHKALAYYAATAPFQTFAHFGITSTPEAVREFYPDAFSVNYIAGSDKAPEKRAELLESVKRGDILMVLGWFPDPNQALARGIYEEAHPAKKP